MKINFPYHNVEPIEIPEEYDTQVFDLQDFAPDITGIYAVEQALKKPIATKTLCELARGKKRVLVISDDISRPTPVYKIVPLILAELDRAGVKDEHIEFIMALGSHRAMTKEEMAIKLGSDIVRRYAVHNHDWVNQGCLEYIGETSQGVPISVNKLVSQSDLIVGLGSIMPIEICGFTGGGKILIPGVCAEVTNGMMHWTRMDVPSEQILAKADNPIRASIDAMASQIGLDFIVNVILDSENRIIGAVAGDFIEAHRAGCKIAKRVYGVNTTREFDIVIADSFPFDNVFWQANKALDTAGMVVKKGGVVILVAPCFEGFSRTHSSEILEFGYLPVETIKDLVNSGKIKHKVVGVHMVQTSTVAIEKANLILVSAGISKYQTEKVGFLWSGTVHQALKKALGMVNPNPSIAVLKNASRMLCLL